MVVLIGYPFLPPPFTSVRGAVLFNGLSAHCVMIEGGDDMQMKWLVPNEGIDGGGFNNWLRLCSCCDSLGIGRRCSLVSPPFPGFDGGTYMKRGGEDGRKKNRENYGQ